MSDMEMFYGNFLLNTHPVWILLGDISNIQKLISQYIESINNIIDINDVQKFELSKDNILDLDYFLSYNPLKIKIAICTIKSINELIIGMLLKRLEDIPRFTKIIIISNCLPDHIINRGIVIYDNKQIASKNLFDLMDNNREAILSTNQDRKIVIKSIMEWMYIKTKNSINNNKKSDNLIKLCSNLIDIYNWMQREMLNEQSCIEMMLSLINLHLK